MKTFLILLLLITTAHGLELRDIKDHEIQSLIADEQDKLLAPLRVEILADSSVSQAKKDMLVERMAIEKYNFKIAEAKVLGRKNARLIKFKGLMTIRINKYSINGHLSQLSDRLIPNVMMNFENPIVGVFKSKYERLILYSMQDGCEPVQPGDCRLLITKPLFSAYQTELAAYKTELIDAL